MTGVLGRSGRSRRDVLLAGAATSLLAGRSRAQTGAADSIDEKAWRSGAKLRWSPPAQSSPKIVSTGPGYYGSPTFDADQDVVVELPASARRPGADIKIIGGRHVRIIGGHTQGRLQWLDGTGSLFVEGVAFDLSATPNRDAIVVSGASGAAPDVYLQNVLVTGVQGTFKGTHADVFQPYGPIGHLRVHAFTGDTNYQGFFIRPENPIGAATFSRVNMKFNALGTPEGNTFLFWCRNMIGGAPAKGDPFFPVVYGPEVYGEANSRAPKRAAAFPPPGLEIPGRDGKRFSGLQAEDGSVRWPEGSGIAGGVLLGPPPGGDFVRLKDVGVGYRSPGYAG